MKCIEVIMISSITFAIVAIMVAMSAVVIVNISGFAFGQNKTSNMSKSGGGNTTSVLNKTSFAGASNPTMAGKIANATK